jgi:hypothetical protein
MAGIRRYLRAILLIAFTCAVCIAPEPPPPTQKQPVAGTTKQPAPNGAKHPQQTTPKPAAADETKQP